MVNSGTINFKNLENAESNITNNVGGEITIQGTLNNHGDFKNYGKVRGLGTVSPNTFTVGDKGAGFGFKNYSTGIVVFNGNTTFQGYTLNDGIIQINNGNLNITSNPSNNMAGTNGRVIVTNGTSTISNSGACFAGTGMKFCDVNTAGHGFDANANPGCVAGTNYTIDCSLILNLKLIGFDFVKQGADSRLRWIVETDLEQNKFVLQESFDGINYTTFETIVDNKKGLITYLSNPLKKYEGRVFYRMGIFQKDGSLKYSNVLTLDNNSNSIKAYPNPVNKNTIYVAVKSTKQTIINIFSIDGRLLLTKRVEGLKNYVVDLIPNIKGNILVEVINGAEFKKFKILVL
ncbi:MAG: T9SS type A sorting domain-containing protein [Chitinophagaceae bacterium]|nr:T9SS type A sorting domain-containing protein [Chitinophagaceae bacterium]